MSLIEFELVSDQIELCDTEDNSYITLTMAQWTALVEYVNTHPLDTHGWMNKVREDGTFTGKHGCPCHSIS